MKLRIKDNSLRMRLSQGEVHALGVAETVSAVINFGTSKLIYQLVLVDAAEVSAVYENNCISINLPKKLGSAWVNSNEVGIDSTLKLEDASQLSILIEKDFKCLTDRPNEDESDLFENPLSEHKC